MTKVQTLHNLPKSKRLLCTRQWGKIFPVRAVNSYTACGFIAPSVANLAPRRRWVINCTHRQLYHHPDWNSSVTHWIGGRLGPRKGLPVVKKRKVSCPYRNSNHVKINNVILEDVWFMFWQLRAKWLSGLSDLYSIHYIRTLNPV
jgi:hypothetical protein